MPEHQLHRLPQPLVEASVSPFGHRPGGAATGGALVRCDEFGPFDLVSAWVHGTYLEGFAEQALAEAATALRFVQRAGDVRTERFLRYTSAIALVEVGRLDEAVEQSRLLLDVVEPTDAPWRAKALGTLADAHIRRGDMAPAIDALAEAFALVEGYWPQAYNEISATMAVGVTLSHAQLFEAAEDLFARCLASPYGTRWDPMAVATRVLVLEEAAMLQATWGAALEIDGRAQEAAAHYVVCGERALTIMRLVAEDDGMLARAEVIEAYAQARLGEPELARARLRAAMSRFSLRPELPEVLLARVGLAQALASDGELDEARTHLQTVVEESLRADRLVWSLTALAALAEVDVQEHGPHAAVDRWRTLAREVTHRLWGERESRFLALRDRMSLRALVAETHRLGQDVLRDPLTGLGNRRLLDTRLRHAVGPHAVLFVDVDRFKEVNDGWNHAVGDLVLQQLADILQRLCRSEDVVVRFGGDEFVVLLPGVGGEEALAVAARVHDAVRVEAWERLAPGLEVTVSVGVADDDDGSRVLAAADGALLDAKRSGRDRVVAAQQAPRLSVAGRTLSG